ncbi:hypothetical protein [Marinovum algicola]|uniref:hypothetical protein n=1 Tax=Marinovum algicola TaxID=42444 RepID=UPI003B521ADD
MTTQFQERFGDAGSYVVAYDTIRTHVDGFEIVARLEPDTEASPREFDAPGCCFDTTDPEYGAENQAIIDAWERDEWQYFGIVLSVSRHGVTLDNHAASLWGVEGNFPTDSGRPDNSYFDTVARELIDEAVSHATELLEILTA